jgi:pSer/pThr/pTyr-binding forkhead associated (FHA) protein
MRACTSWQDDGVGGMILTVKPYLMDLETTNGTFLNGDRIEDQRYYEV